MLGQAEPQRQRGLLVGGAGKVWQFARRIAAVAAAQAAGVQQPRLGSRNIVMDIGAVDSRVFQWARCK